MADFKEFFTTTSLGLDEIHQILFDGIYS